MPGCDKICAQFAGPLHQGAKFQMSVAGDAWIRRASGQIFLREIIDDVMGKSGLKIKYIVGDIQFLRYPAGIFDRRQRAATALRSGCFVGDVLP